MEDESDEGETWKDKMSTNVAKCTTMLNNYQQLRYYNIYSLKAVTLNVSYVVLVHYDWLTHKWWVLYRKIQFTLNYIL